MRSVLKGAWCVLFGGAGREHCIYRMAELGLTIRVIIVPRKRNERLQKAVDGLAAAGFRIEETNKNTLESVIGNVETDFLFSVGFPYILPLTVINRFELCLNIHPTLLPKYQGPTTAAYILINDEAFAGSTVHVIDEGVDTGDIVLQNQLQVGVCENVAELQQRVYRAEPQLVEDALIHLESGKPLRKQDASQASFYPDKRKPEDSQIDPNLPLSGLINHIRGADPDNYPAFFYHKGKKVGVKIWEIE